MSVGVVSSKGPRTLHTIPQLFLFKHQSPNLVHTQQPQGTYPPWPLFLTNICNYLKLFVNSCLFCKYVGKKTITNILQCLSFIKAIQFMVLISFPIHFPNRLFFFYYDDNCFEFQTFFSYGSKSIKCKQFLRFNFIFTAPKTLGLCQNLNIFM